MPRFVELSHKIVPGMKTYPGLPEPEVDVVVDYESSRERYQGRAEFYIASLHLCGNTGTYVDSPRQRYREATDLARDPARPAHTALLQAGIPIGEHFTTLKALPTSGARLHAVPVAWVGGASFPVRAYAILS